MQRTGIRALDDHVGGALDWLRVHRTAAIAVAALALVAAQLAFRAWAVMGGWFYLDDYLLVADARSSGLTWSSLLVPYDAQLMPIGRFVAWISAAPHPVSWPVLAASSLVMQALASMACLLMLRTLFGWRWGILGPLSFYVTCAATMPAFMWWAAALNQLPLQAVFFAAVSSWVTYLRTRRTTWLAVTLVLLVLGLLAYVKTLLVFPVLVFLALGWFAAGGPVARVVVVLRRYWPAVAVAAAAGLAYLAYYVRTAPQIASATSLDGAGKLFNQMVGDSFAPALVGGPWQWSETIAPVAQADSPDWAVHVSWLFVALFVAYLALRRRRTMRAWVLLGAYVGADYALLLVTRAQFVGSVAGTEYRYISDAAVVVVIAIGLATMPLVGAAEASEARETTVVRRPLGRPAVAVLATAVALSGTWSSWSYARVWHDNHPGARFYRATLASTSGLPEVDLANQVLPLSVTGAFYSRANATAVVLPLLDASLRFPTTTAQLHVLDDAGRAVVARIDPATTSRTGPTPRCGWVVGPGTTSIPLRGPAIGVTWWVAVDYLASGDTGARISAGADQRTVDLQRGLGTMYVEMRGPFDAITVDRVDPGVTVCVDTVTVGQPVPTGLPAARRP